MATLLPLLYRLIGAAIVIIGMIFVTKLIVRVLQGLFKGAEAEYVARLSDVVRLLMYILTAIIAAAVIAPEIQVFSILILLIGIALLLMFHDTLRNIGAELYIRYRGLVKKGDWIEIDGKEIRIIDFDALGAWGETVKFERVFIPYTKIVNSIITNRLTLLGLVSRIQIIVPITYDIGYVRGAIEKAVEKVKEELVSEPEVTYVGAFENMHNFIVEIRIINLRKLGKVVAILESELKKEIPSVAIKA
jgi:small conductance mechanosensitive channel